MKNRLLIILGFILTIANLHGQEINGIVIDSLNESPLTFVNIGVIGTSRGTITNEQGLFKLKIDKLSIDSRIRFSMIGYESQTFALSEFKNQKNSIELKKNQLN